MTDRHLIDARQSGIIETDEELEEALAALDDEREAERDGPAPRRITTSRCNCTAIIA